MESVGDVEAAAEKLATEAGLDEEECFRRHHGGARGRR